MISTKKVYICPRCLVERAISNNSCTNCGANRYGFKSGKPEHIAKKLIETAEAIETAFSEINSKQI